jgi:cell division inhibitor SepF
MGALRKAGVWLGLVPEDDVEHADGVFDDDFGDEEDEYAPPARPRSLTRQAQRTAERPTRTEDRSARVRTAERELRLAEQMHAREDRAREERAREDRAREDRARSDREYARTERTERAERDHDERDHRGERAGVRQLARPSGYQTQDNLALAPQRQSRPQTSHAPQTQSSTDDKNCQYRITTLHPTSYSEARAIGEHFRDGHPVIMNLTEMDEPDAKRLVDFGAGLAFGLRGSMERVTNRVFLLSPPNIQVSAEDKARIAEGGFFEQP